MSGIWPSSSWRAAHALQGGTAAPPVLPPLCCVDGCVVGHYHLHPLHSWQDILLTFAEMELDSTTMFPPGTSVMFICSTGEPVLAQVVGHSEHGQGVGHGGSPPGGRATGAPGRKTGRKAQRHRGAPCGAGRTGGAPCGDIQLGGEGKHTRHKDFRGGSGPTSCLLAMKRHGPFSSPGHVRDHEPFFIHWDRAIPQPGYPQP